MSYPSFRRYFLSCSRILDNRMDAVFFVIPFLRAISSNGNTNQYLSRKIFRLFSERLSKKQFTTFTSSSFITSSSTAFPCPAQSSSSSNDCSYAHFLFNACVYVNFFSERFLTIRHTYALKSFGQISKGWEVKDSVNSSKEQLE